MICQHKMAKWPNLGCFKLAWKVSLRPHKLRQAPVLCSRTLCFRAETAEFKCSAGCFSNLFIFYFFIIVASSVFGKARGSELNLAACSTTCSQRGSGYWWYVAAAAGRSLVNSDTLRHNNERCMIKLHQYDHAELKVEAACYICCVASLQSLPVETPAHSTHSTHILCKES